VVGLGFCEVTYGKSRGFGPRSFQEDWVADFAGSCLIRGCVVRLSAGWSRAFWCGRARVGSRDGAESDIYGDAPLLKQPFWDVAPILVSLAPGAELTRRRIRPCRKLQLPDPQFEFSSESGSERNGTPPIGVSAFALRSGESNRYRHRPRSYSVSLTVR
jgi:hypothetical protein